MATSELDVILRALWKGQGIRDAKRDLEEVERAGKRSGRTLASSFGDIAKAAGSLGAAVYAAKKAFDFAKEGAELNLLEDRFGNLSASIGTTADALINDLGAATGGMMSNAEMMASASQIISLGLGSNKDEVVDLASLVSNLGWDMQQVIMTFANNSKARLDALGLSVTDVEGRMKLLEDQGYDTDKAFDLAVIEAGKAKLKLLGSAADTSVGALARMQAAFEDVGDAAKKGFAAGLSDAISLTADATDEIRDLTEATEDYTRMLTQRTLVSLGLLTNLFPGLTVGLASTGWAMKQGAEDAGDFGEGVRRGLGSAIRDDGLPALEDLAIGMRDVRTGAEMAVWATRQFGDAMTGAGEQTEAARTRNIDPALQSLYAIARDWRANVSIDVDTSNLERARAMMVALLSGRTGGMGLGGEGTDILGGGITGAGDLLDPTMGGGTLPGEDTMGVGTNIGTGGSGGTGPNYDPHTGDPTGPGRAHGGPVSWGRPYMVGERGPELFVPSRSGTIVPSGAAAGNTYQIFMGGGMALEFTGRVSGGYMADKLAVAR